MFSRRPVWLISLALVAAPLAATESNRWPLAVEQTNAEGKIVSSDFIGPLLFNYDLPGKPHQEGFRPFYLKSESPEVRTQTFLYPLFVWQTYPDYRTFTFFKLYNRSTQQHPDQTATERFDVWPFYFSRTTPDQEKNYRALFPFYGTIKERFWRDRIEFAAFPLYARTQKAGRQITHTPWPFIRVISGDQHHGFEFWPFFGNRERTGDYSQQFFLWPFVYQSRRNLSAAEPAVSIGVLPFYTRDTAPGYRNENFLWPFFGYTHRTLPHRYDEQRYLWPFFVQGRGDQRFVNRWGPFYTHSVIKGMDKTWILWPFVRHASWSEEGVAQEKNQFLLFLYWSLQQRSLTNPHAAPASKTHLWPVFSSWDNGAGRRQFQLFSPFEVFFPTNDTIRQLYTPLLAVYRYNRLDDQTSRHSLLWNAVTYERAPCTTTFNLGPLVGITATPAEERVAIGRGLVGLKRKPGERVWRPFLFDFPAKMSHQPNGANQP